MSWQLDAWRLPSADRFIDEVETALDRGLVAIMGDDAMPRDLIGAIKRKATSHNWICEVAAPTAEENPAEAVSRPFGARPSLDGVLSGALYEHLLLLDLRHAAVGRIAPWQVFLQRFHEKRRGLSGGLAIVVQGLAPEHVAASGLPAIEWRGRLRRLDVTLWADLHAPERPEPLASLATALSVELCAWRLDLAVALVQARTEDILSPIEWLERRDELPIPGSRSFGQQLLDCPIDLLQRQARAELRRRVWRAQLAAFFPWLEEQRLAIVGRHIDKLVLDDHLRKLGVQTREDIELGALAWQLGKRAGRDAPLLYTLAKIRNDLAHRQPAQSSDLLDAIRAAA